MRLSLTLRASLAALITALSAPAFAEVRYTVETLPFDGDQAPALNNLGQVVGFSSSGAQGFGTYLRDSDGQTRFLGGASSSMAIFFINNKGDAVWALPDGELQADPVYYYDHQQNSTTRITPSPFLPGGINDKGQVSGIVGSTAGNQPNRVVAWQPDTGAQDVLGLAGRHFYSVRNINEKGQFFVSGDGGSYLHTPGQALQALPSGQRGVHINDAGDYIVDNTNKGQYQLIHGGTATDLIGSANGFVFDLNNQGVALGTAYGGTFDGAFVVDGTGMHALASLIDPTLAISLGNAWDINDRGQVLTMGTDSAGVQRTFLLTPVPEPSAVLMVLAGGLVAARSVSRRRGGKMDQPMRQ